MSNNQEIIRQVGPRHAKSVIRAAFKCRQSSFMWGPPGIGKSDIVKQLGEELNREVIDVRLALWDPTDVKGIPYYDSESNRMQWAPPVELPNDPESTAIIFLDELTSAPPAVQAAAYQLILNRRVGTYELPKGVDIVAAGNREGDRGVTYRMPSPLANRFTHCEMKVDFDDYVHWATSNNIHPQVVGYLSSNKQDLFDFDSRSASRSFASPRSWSFVSNYLYLFDEEPNDDVLTTLISGCVGDGLALKFMAHRKIACQLPKAIDILEGKITKSPTDEISALYSMSVSLCYELKEHHVSKSTKFNKYYNNFFTFIMSEFPAEIVIMATYISIATFQLPVEPKHVPAYKEFSAKYSKYILSAR